MTILMEQTARYVRETLAGDSTGHDWWHIERVWKTSLLLARQEQADLQVVQLAALLHDIGDWKFHGGDEAVGPRLARDWLSSQSVDPAVIEAVCQIIANVSFKGAGVVAAPLSLEGQIVQDADRLDAIGAIGIGRAFAYSGAKGRAMHDPDQRPEYHASFAAYQNKQSTTINHFHEKLLLLKDRMNTAAARALAEERHAFMLEFLRRFEAEWTAQDPATGSISHLTG